MSSTILKKAKKALKTQAKQPIEVDAEPIKERKPKLAKREEYVHNTTLKPAKDDRRKATKAEETRRGTVPATPKRVDQATRPARRKLRGPWRAPSSPSPSPTSDFEPSQLEGDEPEASQKEGGDEEDGPGEENVHLYGFSTDEDSSDDDLDVGEEAELDLGSLPTVARDDATVKRKLEKAKKKPVRLSCPRRPLIAHSMTTLRRAGVRNGRSLSRPNSTRLLRGSAPRIFLSIRRDITSPPFAEQEGASAPVLRPTLFGALKYNLRADWQVETLWIRRVCVGAGRPGRRGDDGQLSAHGPHLDLQGHPERRSAPGALDRCESQVARRAHVSPRAGATQ